MDIETAADLTNESWVKLVKAKSRGLTHTFVTEAINSEKAWEEIKELLRLKLFNTNIHTYTSHFMGIQQWEKESLAAYVHWFKTKAKWCNFTNNTATITVFVKGLKMPTGYQHASMKMYLKHLLMSSQKWKNSMPHSNPQQQSSHPSQSM